MSVQAEPTAHRPRVVTRPNRAHRTGLGHAAVKPLGPPLAPERAPGRNALQRMTSMMRDQLKRLIWFHRQGMDSPKSERARAVTMLRVAFQAGAVLPFVPAALLRDASDFAVARAELKGALSR